MKKEINTWQDLLMYLDDQSEGIKWNQFYTARDKPAPFLKYRTLPDKMLVEFLKAHQVCQAVEFGCGEGRNAIYLGRQNIPVVAFDLSEIAIAFAKERAKDCHLHQTVFVAGDIFQYDFHEFSCDLVIDSGLFHHLTPHRRLVYLELLKHILKKDGYFILLCMTEAEGEVDDSDFYGQRQVGTGFSKERLQRFFGQDFDFVFIRQGEDIITDTYQENSFVYCCLLKRR